MRFKSLMGGFIGATLLMGVLCAAASIEQPQKPSPAVKLSGICTNCVVMEPPRPRFEVILSEVLFTAYHDRETGQEIVCTTGHYGDNARSCWLTGRVW